MSTPPPGTYYYPCSECDGQGGFLFTRSVRGEAIDADQEWADCDYCQGIGYDDEVLVCKSCDHPIAVGIICHRCAPLAA